MISTESKSTKSIRYPQRTVERAERAVYCAPFCAKLYATMRWQSVDLKAIAAESGVQNQYTRRPIAELSAENDLLWLIQVGVLRREVDGQGLTDSFRLTPLGHQLVEKWQRQGSSYPSPSLLDHLYNALSRWLQLPAWLK